MSKWRVFWVPKPAPIAAPRAPVLAGWTDLAEREASTGIRSGDPILLAPDYRIDELLSLYTRSNPFRGYTKETKRNYITDLCLFPCAADVGQRASRTSTRSSSVATDESA